MKIKKICALLLTMALSVGMLTGCVDFRTYTAVADSTLYQSEFSETDNVLTCNIYNATMGIPGDIASSETLQSYIDNYTLEVYDDNCFILLCDMYNTTLDEQETVDARECLEDYFEETAVSLNLNKVEARYVINEDTSPISGEETDFYKIVFNGAKIDVEGQKFEGSAALLNYDNICVACVIGTADGEISQDVIDNMMKTVAMTDSGDYTTGDSKKPLYELPEGITSDFDTDTGETTLDLGSLYETYHKTATDVEETDIFTTAITINDTTFELPCNYNAFADAGLTPDVDGDTIIDAFGSEIVSFTLDDGSEISVAFSNNEDTSLPLSECAADGIMIDEFDLRPSTTIVLGKTIVLGETTILDILSATDVAPGYIDADGEGSDTLTYDESTDYYLSNSFDFENEVLTSIDIFYSVY